MDCKTRKNTEKKRFFPKKLVLPKKLAAFGLGLSLTLAFSASAFAAPYTVKKNDTFWKLSQAYHIPLSDILKANPGVHPKNLQIGQQIELPHGGVYVVKHNGETFFTIAKKLGIPLAVLMKANQGVDPSNIYAGLKLLLPDVQAAEAKAANAPEASATKASAANALAAKASAASAKAPVSAALSHALPANMKVSKAIDAKATAYSSSPAENKWGPVDYFGNPLRFGTVAVDPKVIPLNSTVYITGYTFDGIPAGFVGKATDTGSAVKGNHVDIFLPGGPQVAKKFGIQKVKVYILK